MGTIEGLLAAIVMLDPLAQIRARISELEADRIGEMVGVDGVGIGDVMKCGVKEVARDHGERHIRVHERLGEG